MSKPTGGAAYFEAMGRQDVSRGIPMRAHLMAWLDDWARRAYSRGWYAQHWTKPRMKAATNRLMQQQSGKNEDRS